LLAFVYFANQGTVKKITIQRRQFELVMPANCPNHTYERVDDPDNCGSRGCEFGVGKARRHPVATGGRVVDRSSLS
jgi:hypothetical protein